MHKVMGFFMLTLLSLSLSVQAAPPVAKSAPAEAVNKDWKILLFTIPGCTSCQMMVNDVIGPMMETGEPPRVSRRLFGLSQAAIAA